jgi:predicted MFS family arabinose efflux permease
MLADRIGSEKELAAIGFLIMAGTLFGFAYLPNMSIPIVALLLFFSRVGAATTEAMTEIHFFKIVDSENPMYVSLFRDLGPLSNVVTPIIAVLALSLLPFKLCFAVFGVILVFGFFVTFFMEKKQEWWIRAHKN